MADWAALDFRKLYMPFSVEFEQLPYLARAIGGDLIRRCDRLGHIVKCDARDGCDVTLVTRIKFHLRAHDGEELAIEQAVKALLKDGYLIIKDGYLTIRNYPEAQRSRSADRMAKKRARNTPSHSDASDVTSVTSDDDVTVTYRGEEKEEKDPPIAPQGGGGEISANPELARRGYAAGVRAVTKTQWHFPDKPEERRALSDVVALYAPGLRGDMLEAKMTAIASNYAEATRERAQFEGGFKPSKCLEWFNAGAPGAKTSLRRTPASMASARTNKVQEELLKNAGSR
jgi:hypothetical protein